MRPDFTISTLLKSDAFSETLSGYLGDDPAHKVAIRRLDDLPLWSRPIARLLARREARALKAADGIAGCPTLIHADRDLLIRDWADGTPLHLAKPDSAAFYKDAKRLLRHLRRAGVTHNDNAKPQNWLMTPTGGAALIDFQLAIAHRRRGVMFHTMAREDLRHLLKQKRAFAPALLTASEHRLLARKSLPARLWMATVKPAYNFVTRRLLHWSDGEGTEDRIDIDGPRIASALDALPSVTGHFTCTCPGVGRRPALYTFVETALPVDRLRAALPDGVPHHLQTVAELPRTPDGTVDEVMLTYIAQNRLDEIDSAPGSAQQSKVLDPIIAGRLNLTDRA